MVIYKIIDAMKPNLVRYVGCTSATLNMRLVRHRNRSPAIVRGWLTFGCQKTSQSIIEIERCDRIEAREREKHWIQHFSTASLLNYPVWQREQSRAGVPWHVLQSYKSGFRFCLNNRNNNDEILELLQTLQCIYPTLNILKVAADSWENQRQAMLQERLVNSEWLGL